MLPNKTGNTEDVVTPLSCALLRKPVEVELEITRKFLRVNYQLPIWPRSNCYIRREGNCGRHDKAIVIVGVFANQIDASGRAENSRAMAEKFFEVLGELACLH